jgi:hypothetical protein
LRVEMRVALTADQWGWKASVLVALRVVMKAALMVDLKELIIIKKIIMIMILKLNGLLIRKLRLLLWNIAVIDDNY